MEMGKRTQPDAVITGLTGREAQFALIAHDGSRFKIMDQMDEGQTLRFSVDRWQR